MRHLGSLMLAMVAGPLALALAGRGLGAYFDATEALPPDPLATATAVAALGLAGLLLALLTLPRFSPLGPVLVGVGYLGVGLWALADLSSLLTAVPAELVGLDDRAVAVTAGVCPLLATPLLVTLFSAQRWRGRSDRRAGYAPQGGYPSPDGYPPQAGYGAYPGYAPAGWYSAPAAPARPLEMTREFPAVPARKQPAEPAREWPTEPIPTSPPPRPSASPPSPAPTRSSAEGPVDTSGEDTVTEALSTSAPEQGTEATAPAITDDRSTSNDAAPDAAHSADDTIDVTRSNGDARAAGRSNGDPPDADVSRIAEEPSSDRPTA